VGVAIRVGGLCCGEVGGGSGNGEEIDDILDGFVGAVVGAFETAVWPMLRVRSVVHGETERGEDGLVNLACRPARCGAAERSPDRRPADN
jgi:hypothetical protein